MRTAAALLALLALALAAAAAHVAPGAPRRKVLADKALLTKQKGIAQLLVHLQQPNMFLEQKSIGDQWNLEAQVESYGDAQVVKQFVAKWKKGTLLPRGEIFSLLYNRRHMTEAVDLFDLFFFAKDWDTFYKTACWARDRVNEGAFAYALYAAVTHRADCKQLALPPVYEVVPHYFVHAHTIEQAMKARMQYAAKTQETRTVVIPANYSRAPFMKPNPEYMMAPFAEDVGLNAFYGYFHLVYPFWMGSQRYGQAANHFGEMHYYVTKQILARYNLQRLALGLPEVESLKLDRHLKHGYAPMLRYPNGVDMPTRPDDQYVRDDDDFDKIQALDDERRIRDAIDMGYVTMKDGSRKSLYEEGGFETLSRLVAGSVDSANVDYYGVVMARLRRLLGFVVDPEHTHGTPMGPVGNLLTALRDPAYYQMSARVDYLFRQYKKKLGAYSVDQLSFPGVRVENVETDKLITYFDDFDVDLMNAVHVSSAEDSERLKVVARTQRLNYKPFTYKFTINSDKAANVMVRVFLGPKYDAAGGEMRVDDLRRFMVEMDRFPHKVAVGQNVITRDSIDSTFTAKDRPSTWEMLRKVDNALNNREEMFVDEVARPCGFPQRLLLPKVYKTSMPFVLFVMVTPYQGPMEVPESFGSCGVGYDAAYPDTYPMGFPFDRPIKDWEFYTPNMFFKDVLVFHKKTGDLTTM